MKFIRYIPIFALPLILYNALVFSSQEELTIILNYDLFGPINLISGAVLVVDVKGLLLIISLFLLFLEIVKATRTSEAQVLDHAMSMLIFVIYLVEFIVVAKCGTMTFVILTVMSLTDVIAGFTVSLSTARRDIAIG
ncbi:hypothetical protein QUF76_16160 [Desulfobacterales bacterium HSG16]|nr:hypothetical protein [Desulfobacterales bacterium HSG16]